MPYRIIGGGARPSGQATIVVGPFQGLLTDFCDPPLQKPESPGEFQVLSSCDNYPDTGGSRHALGLNWTDFEDAIQAACAEKAEMDYLVTRDKTGFKKSAVKPVTPSELLALIQE